jgi:hypothetical protein
VSLPSWATVTAVRLRAPLRADPYGNPTGVRDWDSALRADIPGCALAPLRGAEVLDNRDRRIIRRILRCPPHADVTATDRVEVKALVYEVDGEPEPWQSPSGALAHLRVVLRLVKG